MLNANFFLLLSRLLSAIPVHVKSGRVKVNERIMVMTKKSMINVVWRITCKPYIGALVFLCWCQIVPFRHFRYWAGQAWLTLFQHFVSFILIWAFLCMATLIVANLYILYIIIQLISIKYTIHDFLTGGPLVKQLKLNCSLITFSRMGSWELLSSLFNNHHCQRKSYLALLRQES